MKSTIYNIQSTIPHRCDNCFFSVYMFGPDRPALTCKQKANFVGRWRMVALVDSCDNFYPSAICKLPSRQARPIPLTQGKFALVDSADYYDLIKYRWFAESSGKTFYAIRSLPHQKKIKMHRHITNAPADLVVDHIDHNGLNNCRSNLRLCTRAQNIRNAPLRNSGTSKYKGVSWFANGKKWVATIRSNNKRHHIGYFDNEITAAKAYDEKAKELHREFACLNFPPVASKL